MSLNRVVVGPQKNAGSIPFTARGGKEGQQIIGHLHGKYAEAAQNGQVFMAYTVIAGVALPTAAATLNSKFTIHNPAGSGVNVELIRFAMGIDSATTVVNGVGLAIQRALSTTSGVPTSTTALTPGALGLGGTPKCAAYSQATLTNVAIPGVTAATAVPIPFYPMFSFGAVTAAGIFPADHNFDGAVWLGPDDLAAGCCTVAPATAAFIGAIWAEYPI